MTSKLEGNDMTKVMWLGEDSEGYAGPSHIIWNGVKFPKDVAVEVTDAYMLGKVRNLGENRYFKVIEGKQEESHGADLGESQTQGEEKTEDKGKEEKGYDYREKEKGSGYSPVKKKVRKKKPQAQDRDPDTTAARVSTPDP
jgi:hypothetical protein